MALVSGCKLAPKKIRTDQPLLPQVSEYHLHRLIPYTLRVRRPTGEGANPKAGPGGTDYRSNPLPDSHFDCKDVASLFSETKLADVRACIAKVQSSARASYRLRRGATPYYELDESDDAAACLRTALPLIPLPREIFFQSNEGDRLACYASRLPVEGDEVVGFKLPISKQALKLDFPLATQPRDDDETRMLLMSWALTPFWENNGASIKARLVPDSICVKCLGEGVMLKPTDPEPMLWPD